MPILELPQLHLPEAGLYLEAVMSWPRADNSSHIDFVAAAHNEAMRRALSRNGDQPINPCAVSAVAKAAVGPRLEDISRREPLPISPAGVIRREAAARIFIYVIACADAKDPKEPPTLEHARKMVGTAGGKYGLYPGMGRSELIDIWDEYSPAVHLIAAKGLFGDEWERFFKSAPSALLARFLATAEHFRKRGETHRPARSKTPLLDASATWRIPDWLLLRDDAVEMPTPAMLRSAMAGWPSPRDVHKSADMSA